MKKHFEKQRIAVLGLGDTGFSALRWLRQMGAEVVMFDSRLHPAGQNHLQEAFPEVEYHLGPFNFALLSTMDLIVASPGVSLKDPCLVQLMAQGKYVVGDVELFARFRAPYAKVIAITGSNGKTTVTTLVGEICKQAGLNTIVAGNIGLPVLDTLQMSAPDVYVLELSSFQLETLHQLQVDAATILNLSEDHMDRYDSMEEYAQAKARIYKHARLAVVNRDDPVSAALAGQLPQVSFGVNPSPTINDYGLNEAGCLCAGHRHYIEADSLQIRGKHNIANALAAIALTQAIGIDKVSILNTVKSFSGLPHRVEWVASIDQIDFYDDSKGTNVGATCAAISGMLKQGKPQKVVLIAGGDGKGQDFTPLREAVLHHARAVVLIGRDAPKIQHTLQNLPVSIVDAVDLPAAVHIAKTLAEAGDAVLLSPACASFDMFRNYEHRAEVFVEAVKAMEAACLAR
ncbi:UDP-N-acetylmuramoyl-L-alanine--D-glutamate ligase [Methylophilus medardicus]|uniref:UDP-N-acetylmuramoylalanine--D-glutamate ligase n=1 Tax=Methylophilus medardicus TaxID=2588534 RepID=A0A5B8CUH7_9PROT|nr:UDP-N-acetylmuramoyl-L-alanine--D-glutamate ligase [Methylophilus medardicus]QDC44942.1 UDP-N-acetylmuramoyl-L-alanine--D-glutamate ligase [Methylophilus medardicus]QDC49949.1 UDP-N-acetylmuramoyl-L-alanine--D-glutamate ligase [Methylophilus medardicus]QDC53654.1 UDP-N-acetylmuramoyl-L-alanine--D-glutamate ligase [Methylophilus medardicus]